MPLSSIRITGFRCVEAAELDFSTVTNLIVGPNGAGKTSVLEAIAFLGRGRSFRGAPPRDVVQHGKDRFTVSGVATSGGLEHRLGVQNGPEGLEIRVDGERGAVVAELAERLPLQIVDPDVHELVAGGPERRRRYLDWLLFHVERGYLAQWRRFRRVLKQRNAALKLGDTEQLDTWDREFAEAGEAVSLARAAILERSLAALEDTAGRLLNASIGFEYRQGWPEEAGLLAALQAQRSRDLVTGTSQYGPHRAELKLRCDDRLAKKLVSRGQQKLLACALVLGATEVVQTATDQTLLLLLDDPAAELDRDALQRLLGAVKLLKCQVIATALEAAEPLLDADARLFHVEQGQLTRAL